jgi:hypothetical protein
LLFVAFADAKKPQAKKTLKEEEKDKGVEMTQDFEGEMYDIPSEDEQQDDQSDGMCIISCSCGGHDVVATLFI